MLQTIAAVNQAVNNFIWGVPAMVCIIGVGLLLSVRTGFIQIRKFPYAIKTTIGRMFRKRDASDGAMTPFQAVCTARAGTAGPGHLPEHHPPVHRYRECRRPDRRSGAGIPGSQGVILQFSPKPFHQACFLQAELDQTEKVLLQ